MVLMHHKNIEYCRSIVIWSIFCLASLIYFFANNLSFFLFFFFPSIYKCPLITLFSCIFQNADSFCQCLLSSSRLALSKLFRKFNLDNKCFKSNPCFRGNYVLLYLCWWTNIYFDIAHTAFTQFSWLVLLCQPYFFYLNICPALLQSLLLIDMMRLFEHRGGLAHKLTLIEVLEVGEDQVAGDIRMEDVYSLAEISIPCKRWHYNTL